MTENCLSSTAKYIAVWYRDTDYRKRSIEAIKSNSERRDVYDNDDLLAFTLENVQPDPAIDPETGKPVRSGDETHRARYKLDSFTVRPANKPYPNHTHHMIPARGFFSLFNSDQKEILMRVEYDVNNENNLIILPSLIKCCRYHNLPWHETTNFHSDYNVEVQENARTITKRLNDIIAQQKPCTPEDNIPSDLPDQLYKLENCLWNILVNAGAVSINTINMKGKLV